MTGAPVGAPGRGIVRLALLGTAVFVLAAVAAAVAPDALSTIAAGIDLVLFAIGCVAFLWGFARSVSRSRTEEISVAGIYFLSGGSGPSRVRRVMMGALVLQVVVAVATAATRPFTNLAFGILVPVFGLGMAGLWTARHGTFPPRSDDLRRGAPSRPGASGAPGAPH